MIAAVDISNKAAVILGSVFTLAAVLVGAGISRRQEHRTWLRNKRTEVYSSLIREGARIANELMSAIDDKLTAMVNDGWRILTCSMQLLNQASRFYYTMQKD